MTIGWYIHHHGLGHLQRWRAVQDRLDGVVGLSSLPRPAAVDPARWVTLPLDAPADPGRDVDAGGTLHWVPLGHSGLRGRMARIAQWIDRASPRVVVCDVSVEVALLCRLLGVPVVWIAQRGTRVDRAHQLAYSISRVVAPWTSRLTSHDTGLPEATAFVGALSRYDGRATRPLPGERRVLLLLGSGGHAIDPALVADAARAVPDWRWSVAGTLDAGRSTMPARASDVWPQLQAADVVVSSAGSNAIAEVAAARRPLICLPQPRPFQEQHDQARALHRAGLAESAPSWPAAATWPALLERARRRDPARWALLHDGLAADRLADVVLEHACESA